MSEIISINAVPLPSPRVAITIRAATMNDLPFIDSLQKKTSKQVGFMPTKQFEGKINAGHIIIAETNDGERAGYLVACDRYFKHDDVGVIYQVNVAPEYRRSLVAASLLKAQFERSAYGCKLYCCWCAQDIEANKFWESMGFVPLAYRAGSATRGKNKSPRVHIFWQKRIRAGDTTTPWWFPSQTSGGSIREDRLVLPIRPGMHWSDEQPLLLPAAPKQIEDKTPRTKRATKPVENPSTMGGGLFFAASTNGKSTTLTKATPKPPRVKGKNDPKLIAAARELRDRWLEQVNTSPTANVGKYDVTRVIDQQRRAAPLLPATHLLAA